MNIMSHATNLESQIETAPFLHPTGFREYDVRWRYPEQVNLTGIQALGSALGTQIRLHDLPPQIIVGHDFRWYSAAIKYALVTGLMQSGIAVTDIGLALSPTAYFARDYLNIGPVAMITASHNDNGWTGIKMGLRPPFTHTPDDVKELRRILENGHQKMADGGGYHLRPDVADAYLADLQKNCPLPQGRKLRAVIASGNGTAGHFAVPLLKAMGIEVIERHTQLDYSFPHYNPNPEDLTMLDDLSQQVLTHKADLGMAFDGDGDRCGVIDDQGRPIFADKMGVLLARDWLRDRPGSHFIADVKSTALFEMVLKPLGASIEYWKTGHSYMKRHVADSGALAGFEKSGHYFLAPPLGRGYDDGLLSALYICRLLMTAELPLSAFVDDLPQTFLSPTLTPYCADEEKYALIDNVTHALQQATEFLGHKIENVNTINGIRLQLAGGHWVLIRASSNQPHLVIVAESMTSIKHMQSLTQEAERIIANIDGR